MWRTCASFRPSGASGDAARNLQNLKSPFFALRREVSFDKINVLDTSDVHGDFCELNQVVRLGSRMAQKQITGIKHNGVLLLSRDAASPLPDDVLTAGFFTQPVKLPGRTWTFSAPFNILGAESE